MTVACCRWRWVHGAGDHAAADSGIGMVAAMVVGGGAGHLLQSRQKVKVKSA